MVKRSYKPFFVKLGVLFSLILIIVLILNLALPDRSFSEKENRVLASMPEADLSLLMSGRQESKYETYANDQFLLRDFWITLKAGFDRLIGKVEVNGVYLCKDGYLMEGFVPPSDERLSATMNAVSSFSARHPELSQYFLLAPNAVTVLRELLPSSAPVPDQNIYLDQVRSSAENAGITFIDVRSALSSHKDEQLYYRTDHHWTTEGAYYAYLAAAVPMDLNTALITYEKKPATKSFQGTLSAKSGFRSGLQEEIDVFLPLGNEYPYIVNYVEDQTIVPSFYSTEKLAGRDKYAMFFNGNHARVTITTPEAEDRSLLVLKDSYANCFIPFLSPHYRNIILIDPRYYSGNLDSLIEAEGIQEILYLYNANTFFSDSSLELTLLDE